MILRKNIDSTLVSWWFSFLRSASLCCLYDTMFVVASRDKYDVFLMHFSCATKFPAIASVLQEIAGNCRTLFKKAVIIPLENDSQGES